MLTWAEALVWALKLLFRVTSYLQTQALLDAGGAQVIAETLRAQADDLDAKRKAMADAGRRFDDAAAHGMRPPDQRFRD